MIKIGNDVIAFTQTAYGVEFLEPLVSLSDPITIEADSRHEAEDLARTLNGEVKTRTVYTSEWGDPT